MTGGKEKTAPKLNRKKLIALLRAEFPQMSNAMSNYEIEEVWHGGCRLRYPFSQNSLRPGGTLSGTTMMSLADFAMYVAVLSAVGWVPLAVTTNLTINFLRKPAADKRIVGVCRLIKVGRVQAVGEVHLYSEGISEVVAHAVGTYSIPRRDGS